jgi:acetyl esterase/lipase
MEQSAGGRRHRAPRETRLRHAALLALLAFGAGCSPLRVAEVLLLGDHFALTTDLPYGDAPRQRLDVYRPLRVRAPAPVVVFLYGGRWQSGSRDQYRLLGDALARRGIVTVVPDYRLYPEVRFPAWVKDAASSVRWTRQNIRRFGGDPDRIFVVGHSAGAHTAVLLALDEGYLRAVGVPPGAVAGVVSLAGPVDTVWTDPDVQALMGPREGWPATYPVNHLDGAEPRLLLLHGGGDDTVAPANSVDLAARIRARGGCAEAIVYPGVGHVEIIIALSVPRLGSAPVMDDLTDFIRGTEIPGCPRASGR